MMWLIMCGIYMRWFHSRLKEKSFPDPNHYTEYHKRSSSHYALETQTRKVTFTKIGVIIPALFNEYTLHYLHRILHNIYLSQIDFEPDSYANSTTSNTLYYPSEVIISMSLPLQFQVYEENLTQILDEYRSNYLDHSELRLRMSVHQNQTMNAAQNRNHGMSLIDHTVTDYVGFFDIDDIMHPQRIAILHHVFSGNAQHIDFMFHSFIMSQHCRDRHIEHDYLKDFEAISPFMDDATLRLLAWPLMTSHDYSERNAHRLRSRSSVEDLEDVIPLEAVGVSPNHHGVSVHGANDDEFYDKNYCVAYNKEIKADQLTIFEIECDREEAKRLLLKRRNEFEEMFTFDRFYHRELPDITWINYSQLVNQRCLYLKMVKHPIAGKLYDVDCSYGTMAGGLEAFRNQRALTRHHNGWPTMSLEVAMSGQYDEEWKLHGSYRGQDSGFNTEAFRRGARIFHFGYYLGMYCYH